LTAINNPTDGLVTRLLLQPTYSSHYSSQETDIKALITDQDNLKESRKFTAVNPFGYKQGKLESLLIDLISKT